MAVHATTTSTKCNRVAERQSDPRTAGHIAVHPGAPQRHPLVAVSQSVVASLRELLPRSRRYVRCARCGRTFWV